MRPQTRYANSGGVHIAYQVVGEGALDLVFIPPWVSHIEWAWELPSYARLLRGLASFSRLIVFDKRETGLSDRLGAVVTLEQRMMDVAAVMDAAGCARAAVVGASEGAAIAALFAHAFPDRTAALVLYGSAACAVADAEYPWAPPREACEQTTQWMEEAWGSDEFAQGRLVGYAPSLANDLGAQRWWSKWLRLSASPGAAVAYSRMTTETDIRPILSAIAVPTLVVHRSEDVVDIHGARYVAARIPNATFVELPGGDHMPWAGDVDALVGEIEQFLTGRRMPKEKERVLATVVFTDVVGSTKLGEDEAVMYVRRRTPGEPDPDPALLETALQEFRALGGPWLAQPAPRVGDDGTPGGESVEVGTNLTANLANVFRKEGNYWTVMYEGRTLRLKDAKGLLYICHLLQSPGQEFHVADLTALGGGAGTVQRPVVVRPEGDGGAMLDPRATGEYRRRLRELRDEIERANEQGDLGAAARAGQEADVISHALTSAYGLGGRARRVGDPAERLRKAVTNQIRRVLKRIDTEHSLLARHLQNGLRTGFLCSYTPDRSVPWTF